LKNIVLKGQDDLEEFWTNKKDLFIARCDELREKECSWVFQRVNFIRIHINKYTPLRAISYIELPKWIKNTKACINIKNRDNKCFMWFILSALHPPERDPERVPKYRQYKNEF
jgi:hypothetical protein